MIVQTENTHISNSQIPRLPVGWLFQIVLFITFMSPSKELTAFGVSSVITNATEVGLILLPFVYAIYPRSNVAIISRRTRRLIIAFLITLAAFSVLRALFYAEGIFDEIKEIRYFVPLISGLWIALLGVRLRSEAVIHTFCAALIASKAFILIVFLFGIHLSVRTIDGIDQNMNILNGGRFGNLQGSFIIMAICFFAYMRKGGLAKSTHVMIITACLLSIGIDTLSFNRTLLLSASLLTLLLIFISSDLRRTFRLVAVTIIGVMFIVMAYSLDYRIQRQIDKRIAVISYGIEAILDAGYYGNRDVMYMRYFDLAKSYWLLGVPSNVSISGGNTEKTMFHVTDVSSLMVLFKYGVLACILFHLIWFNIWRDMINQKRRIGRRNHPWAFVLKGLTLALPFYFLISLNMDVLVRHTSAFYILLFVCFSGYSGQQDQAPIPRVLN